ncbi:DUF418 domain-containing protein [Saccharopolyspora hirsuta]|uniref:DUF418 domain-containing protein n=1 Tax=Saccharopolyspora hirsuta TaxID=1837 RepID=A0A5M7BG41_SACHI|nr:DUF418 domain-containing protein [Saccharopolyspora hirsuta]KAA5828279.1 DUF418 domain-containing protein [Saccharopolyspora hirsuta]
MNPPISNSPGRPAPPAEAPTVRLSAASGGRHIGELDALRGLALCGILFVNISQILYLRGIVDMQKLPVPHALDMFVHQRFFPIFSLLFGVGFGIFLGNASQRTAQPRVVLLRRLLVLAAFGALHHVLQPGEALLPYAIFGLVVLLPMSFLPWQANLPIGAAMVAATLALTSGGMLLIPGLLLTGFALAQSGLPARLHRLGWQLAAVFAVSVIASAGFLVLQEQDPLSAGFSSASATAGLLMAIAYSTGLFLLLRTPVQRVLSPILEPLGKMALTNYVTATLLIIPFGQLLGMHESTRWDLLLALAAGIILVQILWSRWWLARFQYGPLEWVWRCATWWRIVGFRKVPRPFSPAADRLRPAS